MQLNHHIYDIETFPNIFTYAAKCMLTGERFLYEISWRHNDLEAFLGYVNACRHMGVSLVGFNNLGFDYPVIHQIIENPHLTTVESIYNKAMRIIHTPWDNRFANVIWDQDQHLPQIDLFKIHHFDNLARATSLKVLEFNMKMDTVEDLPFPPGTFLTDKEMDELITYNDHDVDATVLFYEKTIPQIEFRM